MCTEEAKVARYLIKRTVTKDCYDHFLNKYPAIFSDRSLLKMFEYVNFGTFIDRDDTKKLIINRQVLAACENALDDMNNSRYNGGNFLAKYKQIFPNFQETQYEEYTPRMVENSGLDEEDKVVIENNFAAKRHKATALILLREGTKFTSKKMYEQRIETDKHFEENNAELNLHPDQKKVIDYLESLDSNIFSTMFNRNIDETIKLKDSFIFDPTKPNSKPTQERILDYIKEYPKPHYFANQDSNTMRISPASDNFLGLKRELRKSLAKGCLNADLRSSQFAILATQLNAKKAQEFIKSGKKLWNELSLFIKNESICSDEDKADLKTAIYALAFGKTESGTKGSDGKWHPGIVHILQPRNLKKMLQHEMIRELLDQRNKWFKAIEMKGGWNDAYGKFQKISSIRKPRQVAASVIQSIEFKIIQNVFNIANSHGDKLQFKIISLQHDGFYMKICDKRNTDKICKLLSEVVEKEAKNFNVITTLEFEELK